MTNSIGSVFSSRLCKLMHDGIDGKRVTQQDLAAATGYTRQAISQYMDGSVLPNIEKLHTFAKFFNVSADYLLGLTNAPSSDKDIRFIWEYTGLNNESIHWLHKWQLQNDSEIDFINFTLRMGNTSFFSLASMYKDCLEYYKKRQSLLIRRMTLDCPSVLETETMPNELYEIYNDDYSQVFQIMRDVRLSYFDATESFKQTMDRFVRHDSEESTEMERMLLRIFAINKPDEKSDSNNGND